jgi:hypothetical protein
MEEKKILPIEIFTQVIDFQNNKLNNNKFDKQTNKRKNNRHIRLDEYIFYLLICFVQVEVSVLISGSVWLTEHELQDSCRLNYQ